MKPKRYYGLIKLGSLEHMTAFYEKGEMYFNTFKYFKDLEQCADGRADTNEYASKHYAGKNISLKLYPEDDTEDYIVLNKENGLKSLTLDFGNDKKYSHLYSMTAIDIEWSIQNDMIIDYKNFATGKDYAVVIYDIDKFIEKLTTEINEIKRNCSMQFVEYIDLDTYTGDVGPFKKFQTYAYQNEYRIAVNFNCSVPQKLYLGTLSEIANPPISMADFYKLDAKIQSIDNFGKVNMHTISNKLALNILDVICKIIILCV